MAACLPTWLTLLAFISTKSKFKVRVCSARIAGTGTGGGVGGWGGRTPPTVIASPLVCLKIDVIFVILSTLLPCRPRVSRASAPGHLFLHAYKLTSTLLYTATPSSVDEYPESETREVADENGGSFFWQFLHCRASFPSSTIFFFFFRREICSKVVIELLAANEKR